MNPYGFLAQVQILIDFVLLCILIAKRISTELIKIVGLILDKFGFVPCMRVFECNFTFVSFKSSRK